MIKSGGIFLAMILAAVMVVPSALPGNTFVDWRGGFYVSYPDDWFHVPYSTVDIFLQTQGIDPNRFDFDAVLAKKTDQPFFLEPYVFITLTADWQLDGREIDSALKSISAQYGKDYVEGSLKTADVVFTFDRPVYDRSLNAVAVVKPITTDVANKISMEIRKFYEKGCAVFLCYAPSEMYESAKPIFISMLNSFSTRDLDKVAPKESLKVVDLSQRKASSAGQIESESDGDDADGSGGNKTIIISLIVLVVLGAGILSIWANKKKKTADSKID
ncbi:MAG: hypothetical protein NT002_06380 [candidate division Zixibacteria bacterium]|nr:hypothetical protein [candidate division Zixibacteria bacterium]